ncbi:A/G-specific adenine glycosylase [Phyllobacterium endophyticum]|uniref:Adenine DNA glycosylase n=1 Tax=Phyllobacterium endophyticum TaxID=1149773 RepID=A0A2P7B1M2_9HYPH|nr:A/G-specific adenine glycosylase [Phyllobacterium endophyticum]MBB3237942.1 A/G-specific adenine glycosylase [Phyllobacterium endophyticum]PSH60367.1 A/G-specific adenine glycosylase [Phyllobacterium endophyticum]TYR42544.1 A/G-specific adenine glycosylase [Phyllobacterium endophyticum]
MQPITARSLVWYDSYHRTLPWRISPRERRLGAPIDPYRIWLSEIMLQQTTVEAVKSYFLAFTKRWPTVGDLGAASQDDVLRAWAGLGYYSRARNLKKCADIIVSEHGGRFPSDLPGLKSLPGIGDYTAAAIASIAFDVPAAVVDGNVERVVTRLYAIATPLPLAKTEIRMRMQALTPQERSGDFAQAMMDLGATICTPRRPACAICPLNDNCQALQSTDPELFPVKAPKKEKPIRVGAAFVALADDEIHLRSRVETGLLGGMSEVPTTQWTARVDGETGLDAAPFAANWIAAGSISHVFTHFELRLNIYKADEVEKAHVSGGWWVKVANLGDEALPTVMKKAIAAAVPDAFARRRKAG